jgi:lipoyl(octanoyl) transferase
VWLGRIDYLKAWNLQKTLVAQRLAGEIPDTLLLLEHPPTITIGRSGKSTHVLAAPEELEHQGIALIETDRGGDVTYHGPGQLVGYPILNLQTAPNRPNLHAYLRALEETLIRALAAFDIAAGRFPGYTGVWTGMETPHPEKVAAIGIRISRWITSHGFALNIFPDLSHFDLIVPCGIHGYGVTSLSRLLGWEVSVAEALPVVQSAFAEVFGVHSI